MSCVQRFSAGQVSPQQRLRTWGEQVWSVVGGLEARTFDSEAFEAELSAGSLGPLRLCRMVVGRHRVERTQALIKRNDPELLHVAFPLRGSVFFRQRGVELILHPGQWCVYETSQPYVVAACETVELLVALVPRAALNSKLCDPERCVMKPYSVAGGVSQVLFRSLSVAAEEMESLQGASADQLGDCFVDLLRLALSEQVQSSQIAITARDTLRGQIERYVRRNLADPELSLDSIAGALGCTKRYLHKVFTDRGQTLSSFIWNLRLERCAQELARPENAHKPITAVAFDGGFNNSAHFSRAFKERFGMSPREWRAARRQAQTAVAA